MKTGTRIETTCPSCGSTDTASVEQVYLSQTHRTQSTGVAVIGNDLAVGGLTGSTTSLLADRLAPPSARKVGAHIAFFVAFSLVVGIAIAVVTFGAWPGPRDPRGGAIGMLIFAALLILIALAFVPTIQKNNRFNAQELSTLYKRWRAQWTCRRCGERWTPESKH